MYHTFHILFRRNSWLYWNENIPEDCALFFESRLYLDNVESDIFHGTNKRRQTRYHLTQEHIHVFSITVFHRYDGLIETNSRNQR